MKVYREFDTAQEARDYRREHGTGGWIFEPESGSTFAGFIGRVILFPPELSPAEIFRHPLAKGLSGRLIGAA